MNGKVAAQVSGVLRPMYLNSGCRVEDLNTVGLTGVWAGVHRVKSEEVTRHLLLVDRFRESRRIVTAPWCGDE